MKQKLLKPFAALLCAVSAWFVFSSFTALQVRGGGDDQVVRLEYNLSCSSHVLPLEGVDYVLGDFIEGGGPYWVSIGESDAGTLALHVQSNLNRASRSADFSFTVYTRSGKYSFEVRIEQEGRP